MTEQRPQMEPSDFSAGDTGNSGEISMPSQIPPTSTTDIAITVGEDHAIAGISDAAPALPLTTAVAAGVSAWQSNKRIISLWSINQNRNSWVGVDGVGWKKLANNSDSAIVALTMLGAHAREKGSAVNYREESDGMIYEMYVW